MTSAPIEGSSSCSLPSPPHGFWDSISPSMSSPMAQWNEQSLPRWGKVGSCTALPDQCCSQDTISPELASHPQLPSRVPTWPSRDHMPWSLYPEPNAVQTRSAAGTIATLQAEDCLTVFWPRCWKFALHTKSNLKLVVFLTKGKT